MGDRFKVRRCAIGLYTSKEKGIFGREQATELKSWPDIDGFAVSLEEMYNKFDDEGYDVINVVPVQSGSPEYITHHGPGWVSHSITRTVLVVGQRRS